MQQDGQLLTLMDSLIGIAYISISGTLCVLFKEAKLPFRKILLSFGIFIAACASAHFLAAARHTGINYLLILFVNTITALTAVGTSIYLFKLTPQILRAIQTFRLAERRRSELEVLKTELEDRVAQRTDDLQKALEARDEFITMASHELKTPISSLLLQAQMQRNYVEKQSPKAYDKDRINGMSKQNEELAIHLKAIVENMLDISRIRSGQLELSREQTDIKPLVEDVLERMIPQFLRVGYSIPTLSGESAQGNWDATRIKQVLYNLLSNAIQYGQGKPVEVKLERLKASVRVIVQDHGLGIPEEHQQSIFNRFVRAVDRREVSGLGLGLYISKNIVEAHGGKIFVNSTPGDGSSFIVELPLDELKTNT
ncbi:MAG: HAMP domain-containing histidine kinase [Bacteriovoracaceae bacterium]|nr:HAMP domain-containing histidine kinase [Bacteriovoracaceae bacterium]